MNAQVMSVSPTVTLPSILSKVRLDRLSLTIRITYINHHVVNISTRNAPNLVFLGEKLTIKSSSIKKAINPPKNAPRIYESIIKINITMYFF